MSTDIAFPELGSEREVIELEELQTLGKNFVSLETLILDSLREGVNHIISSMNCESLQRFIINQIRTDLETSELLNVNLVVDFCARHRYPITRFSSLLTNFKKYQNSITCRTVVWILCIRSNK